MRTNFHSNLCLPNESDILGLVWRNVDHESQKITITQSLVRSADKGLIIEPPKTRSSRRTIDIDDDTVRVLQQHKVAQAEDMIFLDPHMLMLIWFSSIGSGNL